MTQGNDIISLYNDYNLRTNISLNNVLLYYGNKADISNDINSNEKVCGIMGFKLHSTEDSYYNNNYLIVLTLNTLLHPEQYFFPFTVLYVLILT